MPLCLYCVLVLPPPHTHLMRRWNGLAVRARRSGHAAAAHAPAPGSHRPFRRYAESWHRAQRPFRKQYLQRRSPTHVWPVWPEEFTSLIAAPFHPCRASSTAGPGGQTPHKIGHVSWTTGSNAHSSLPKKTPQITSSAAPTHSARGVAAPGCGAVAGTGDRVGGATGHTPHITGHSAWTASANRGIVESKQLSKPATSHSFGSV